MECTKKKRSCRRPCCRLGGRANNSRAARATREEVVDAFKRLRHASRPGDDALIYFAGHGRYDEEYTRQGYWVFRDGEWSKSYQLAYHHRIPADDILIVADACFAVSFNYSQGPGEAPIDRERARWVLASGRLEAVQDLSEGEPRHSPFAAELIEFLGTQEDPFSAYELGRVLL